MLAEIIRLESTAEAVLGALVLDGRLLCWTLEPPDRDNAPKVSCIPPGRYACGAVASPRFGRTVAVGGVPGRSHILFHAGNTVEDTEGCILLGSRPGTLDGRRAVLGSAEAVRAFLEAVGREPAFDLLVRRPFGPFAETQGEAAPFREAGEAGGVAP